MGGEGASKDCRRYGSCLAGAASSCASNSSAVAASTIVRDLGFPDRVLRPDAAGIAGRAQHSCVVGAKENSVCFAAASVALPLAAVQVSAMTLTAVGDTEISLSELAT